MQGSEKILLTAFFASQQKMTKTVINNLTEIEEGKTSPSQLFCIIYQAGKVLFLIAVVIKNYLL